jgi:hypothetical protein
MAKTTEEDSGHRLARDVARPPTRRHVFLRYMIARRENEGLVPFCLPLGSEEMLPVFSSSDFAGRFLQTNALGPEWDVRVSSDGEILSLLSGLCAGVGWISFDPSPKSLGTGDLSASFMRRESFVNYLAGIEDIFPSS